MTVYSGKDAKVYLGTYQLPHISEISLKTTRRRLLFQDYHGDVKRYRGKPLVQGSLIMHDVGMPYALHYMPYKTVESESLVGQWDNNLYSIGFPFPDDCTSTVEAYNGQSATILLDIPAAAITENITFRDLHLYVDGVGAPNSAVYQIALYEGGVKQASDTFTWTTNDGRWITISTDYVATNNADWKIILSTSDAGTSSGTCQRIHVITGIEYPFFDTDTGACILEIEDWKATEQKVNMTLEVSTNYTALLSGVVFGETGKTYSAGAQQTQVVTYSADRVKWTTT